MELNAEQRQALELLKSGQNVFLRGDAGTGKTVVINRFIDSDTPLPWGVIERLGTRPGKGSGIPTLSSRSDH